MREKVVERRADIGGLLGDQQGAPVQLVAGDHGAEAVQDAAARRRDQPRADPVLLGQRGVARALDHLHLVEPRRRAPPSSRDLAAHQQQGAAGEDAACVGVSRRIRPAPGSATVRWARDRTGSASAGIQRGGQQRLEQRRPGRQQAERQQRGQRPAQRRRAGGERRRTPARPTAKPCAPAAPRASAAPAHARSAASAPDARAADSRAGRAAGRCTNTTGGGIAAGRNSDQNTHAGQRHRRQQRRLVGDAEAAPRSAASAATVQPAGKRVRAPRMSSRRPSVGARAGCRACWSARAISGRPPLRRAPAGALGRRRCRASP